MSRNQVILMTARFANRLRVRNVMRVVVIVFVFSILHVSPAACQSPGDEFSKATSWQPPDAPQIKSAFAAWIAEAGSSSTTVDLLQQIESVVDSEFQSSENEFIDLILECLIIGHPALAGVRDTLKQQRSSSTAPDFSQWLADPNAPGFLQDHVRLYFGRWLAQNEFYDEALEQFSQIELSRVHAPATLLYYRGLMEHQLLRKDECLATLESLMEHPEKMPRRFNVMSKMMMADIRPLETDSLDEVARIMGDIGRRTGLHRSGQIVRGKEKDVIDKLDKLIEELESKQTADQQGGENSPSKPMQDSMPTAGQGSGDAAHKLQSDGGEWGDLPPAKRAAALAEMAKEMPPHYREVIEEYFKQLAKEDQ